ncbi:MAG: bifunctional aspartate kinase/homoserine dehydrogenase I [Acidobacteriota bacterium]
MKVLKFGGSSLATPERIVTVAGILATALESGPVACVLSAFGGVTDDLAAAARAAEQRDESYREIVERLAERHRAAAESLAGEDERSALGDAIGRAFEDLDDLLRGVWLVREASPRTCDSILSYGERLSTGIVAAALRRVGIEAERCDARRLVVTDDRFGNARVDLDATYDRLREFFSGATSLQVVTGFLGATPAGETTTLGRGGSDYTAALIGAALKAKAVELWTDVDGVLSADPRWVEAASPISQMGYEELMELSHFGAKVVYPPTVHPARSAGVPLWIKNTLNPAFPGTRVEAGAGTEGGPVRGVSSVHRVALMRLEGDGMVGVPGIAMRLFGALAREGISVILISQASSEHSICFAVEPAAVASARRAIDDEFSLEREAGLIEELVVEEDLSIVAVVGSGMSEQTGIAGRLFASLGAHRINVRAIAQGSSERNISLVVDGEDEERAVQTVHEAFFAGPRQAVEIFLAGTGRVGAAFLQQLASERERLAAAGLDLRLAAVANSQTMVASPQGLDPADAAERLATGGEPCGVAGLVDFALGDARSRRIFVDCTASDDVAGFYDRLLEEDVAVVTANKRRLAGPLATFRPLIPNLGAGRSGGRLYFETTVGAGLPVVRSLADLVATGDRLISVEGLFSGTLSFLLDRLESGMAFSEAVRSAHDLGLTEPDPRDDLGGQDVARKLLILARVAGLELEPEDVRVEPLITAEDARPDLDLEDFWQHLPSLDEAFEAQRRDADTEGFRLRYRASLVEGRARVALDPVPNDHPLASARSTENLVVLTTERYQSPPLTIRGPGAGPEVTAAGVFADVLRAVAESPPGTS